MHDGVHPLHREVRALHQTHLDARAAGRDPLLRPRGEALERRKRVGKVGLQHDAGLEPPQPGVLEQPREHRDREIEVAVLLHVEVDEGAIGGRGEVQRPQPLDDLLDHLVERPHRDVAHDRRDLDRDVVHIGPADELVDALQSTQRLLLAEHRLAQQVEVQPCPALAQRRDGGPQLVGARVDDEVAHHAAEHASCDRHHRRRQHGCDGTAHADGAAQVPRQKARHERCHTLQMGCRGRQALGSHHAVDEADGERQPVGVFEHAGETFGRGVDLGLGALGDPALRERHRLGGQARVGSVFHSHSRYDVVRIPESSLHLDVPSRRAHGHSAVDLLHEVQGEASVHS